MSRDAVIALGETLRGEYRRQTSALAGGWLPEVEALAGDGVQLTALAGDLQQVLAAVAAAELEARYLTCFLPADWAALAPWPAAAPEPSPPARSDPRVAWDASPPPSAVAGGPACFRDPVAASSGSAVRARQPGTNAPRTNMPGSNAPEVNMPEIKATPRLDAPGLDVPGLDALEIKAPAGLDAPGINAPGPNAPETIAGPANPRRSALAEDASAPAPTVQGLKDLAARLAFIPGGVLATEPSTAVTDHEPPGRSAVSSPTSGKGRTRRLARHAPVFGARAEGSEGPIATGTTAAETFAPETSAPVTERFDENGISHREGPEGRPERDAGRPFYEPTARRVDGPAPTLAVATRATSGPAAGREWAREWPQHRSPRLDEPSPGVATSPDEHPFVATAAEMDAPVSALDDDLEELMEALERSLEREYRRFYGDDE